GDINLRRSVSSTEAQRKVAWLVGDQAAGRFQRASDQEPRRAQGPKVVMGNQFTGASAEARAQAAKNWTPRPSEMSERIETLLSPKHTAPLIAAEMAGHALGLPGAATAALAVGGRYAAARLEAAAQARSAAIRNAVAPIMTLKGEAHVGALRELLNGPRRPPSSAAPSPPKAPPRAPPPPAGPLTNAPAATSNALMSARGQPKRPSPLSAR